MLEKINISKLEGAYHKFYKKITKPDILLLDDFGIQKFDSKVDSQILDIFDDRYYGKANIIVGQIPQNNWHQLFVDPTIADATLDRLVSNAINLNLKGDSMRKKSNLSLSE